MATNWMELANFWSNEKDKISQEQFGNFLLDMMKIQQSNYNPTPEEARKLLEVHGIKNPAYIQVAGKIWKDYKEQIRTEQERTKQTEFESGAIPKEIDPRLAGMTYEQARRMKESGVTPYTPSEKPPRSIKTWKGPGGDPVNLPEGEMPPQGATPWKDTSDDPKDTALMKNAEYIAQQLKIPVPEAITMLRTSVDMSEADFYGRALQTFIDWNGPEDMEENKKKALEIVSARREFMESTRPGRVAAGAEKPMEPTEPDDGYIQKNKRKGKDGKWYVQWQNKWFEVLE